MIFLILTSSGLGRPVGKVGKVGSLGTVIVGHGNAVDGVECVGLIVLIVEESVTTGVAAVVYSVVGFEEVSIVDDGVIGEVAIVDGVVKVEIVSNLSKASCKSSSKLLFCTANTIVDTQNAVVAKARKIAIFLAVRTEKRVLNVHPYTWYFFLLTRYHFVVFKIDFFFFFQTSTNTLFGLAFAIVYYRFKNYPPTVSELIMSLA